MRRSQVWLAQLDPAQGSEANKIRPVVIVSQNESNDTANRLGRGVVTVVPVTSNVRRVYAFQVLLPASTAGLDRLCKAQAEQVRSIDIIRLTQLLGVLPSALMASLDDALRLHLAL
jgi:mRNA interferase MazF